MCPDVRKQSPVPPAAIQLHSCPVVYPVATDCALKPMIKSLLVGYFVPAVGNGYKGRAFPSQLVPVTLGGWEGKVTGTRDTNSPIFTFNIHPTVHGCLPQSIDGLAGIDASIEGAGLADFQGADPQLTEGSVLGIALEVHFVL